MEKINRRFGGIIVLLLANAVFFVLYLRFFTGEAVYLYTDIGSDSVNSSYPIIAMVQRLFGSRDFSGFSLTAGLGSSTVTYLLKYLNPVKLPLLFFTGERLPLGLIVEILIQTNVIALFSWLFFRRLLDHGTAALFAALAWTFSGYVTLWSQNLTTGSCMAMFTIMMAALLPALEKPTVRRFLLLSLALALFLLTNYYYCYMSAYFVLFFLIFYSVAKKRTVTAFFVSGLEVLGSALFAALMAAAALLPSFSGFSGSGRTDALSVVGAKLSVTSPRGLFVLLGRLFSVNTMGPGAAYVGTMNYYEEAALSTTVLAVAAVVYLISRENTRIVTILSVLLCAAVLLFKNSGAYLQFNIGVRRYAFMIAFAEAIAVGVFIRSLMTRVYSMHLFWSAVISLALCGASVLFLALYDGRFNCWTDIRTLKLVAVCAAGFSLLLVLYALNLRFSGVIPFLCLLLMMGELVVMNYDTLYVRDFVTAEEYASVADGNGVKEAVDLIRGAEDDTLCRIAVNGTTDGANAGMLLDFPAASVYNNTNAQALTTLTKAHGTCELSPNHFIADGYAPGQLSFLAGRYLITSNTGLSADTPSSAFYRKTAETPDGSKAVYENTTALPFGYLYTRQMSASEAKELPLPERILAMTQSCYRTDGISTTEEDQEEESPGGQAARSGHFTATDLLTSGKDANNLKLRKTTSGIVFRPTGGDPYIYYEIGPSRPGNVRLLYLKLRSANYNKVRQMQIFFMSSPDEDPDPADSRLFFLGRGYPETCLILPDDVEKIRLDFPEDYIDTNVAELSLMESDAFTGAFDELMSTDIRDVSMKGGTYSASLNAESEGVLCVPLLYSGCWTAEVNGKKTPVLNINGGLTGIEVGPGKSDVVMTWQIPHFRLGLLLSGAVAAVWLVLMIFPPFRRKSRREK